MGPTKRDESGEAAKRMGPTGLEGSGSGRGVPRLTRDSRFSHSRDSWDYRDSRDYRGYPDYRVILENREDRENRENLDEGTEKLDEGIVKLNGYTEKRDWPKIR